MLSGRLLSRLFLLGLGELLTLRVSGDRVLMGHMAVEKGRVVFKDRDFMDGTTPAQVNLCTDAGIVGAVCELPNREWETLTFLGPHHCDIPVNLSATRTGLLRSTRGRDGLSLIDFEGSWYRAFHVMVENHFLPVATTIPIPTKRNATGLAICDLKMATLPIAVLQRVHDSVRASVDRHLTFDVQDMNVDMEEFNQMFSSYLRRDGVAAGTDAKSNSSAPRALAR
jgi:hypothetical protein